MSANPISEPFGLLSFQFFQLGAQLVVLSFQSFHVDVWWRSNVSFDVLDGIFWSLGLFV